MEHSPSHVVVMSLGFNHDDADEIEVHRSSCFRFISLHIPVQGPATQPNLRPCVTSLSFRSFLSAFNTGIWREMTRPLSRDIISNEFPRMEHSPSHVVVMPETMCDVPFFPIFPICFQCGTDQNPCNCKVVGPTATMVEKNPVDFVRHGLTLQQFTQKN
jgi:hypothetical protein